MPSCLIVEDHGDTREGYGEYLAGSGFDVRMASQAAEFWACIDEGLPDAILMDLRLPEIDGWTLTRQVRADPRTADIPILVVSASVRDEDRALALESGANLFLSKPCDLELIVAELRRLVGAPGS